MNYELIKKAVALRYDMQGVAPKVVAVGAGDMAQRILELAEQNNIPIQRNDGLIDILCKLKLNQNIPQETFRVVAEIFAFLFKTDLLWRERQLVKVKHNGVF
jgi:flagellar biosynthesis protein